MPDAIVINPESIDLKYEFLVFIAVESTKKPTEGKTTKIKNSTNIIKPIVISIFLYYTIL